MKNLFLNYNQNLSLNVNEKAAPNAILVSDIASIVMAVVDGVGVDLAYEIKSGDLEILENGQYFENYEANKQVIAMVRNLIK